MLVNSSGVYFGGNWVSLIRRCNLYFKYVSFVEFLYSKPHLFMAFLNSYRIKITKLIGFVMSIFMFGKNFEKILFRFGSL